MFNFVNMDEKTRAFMLEAIEEAEHNHQMDYSPRLSSAGKQQWPELLQEAAKAHDPDWLASELESRGLVKDIEVAQRPKGGYSVRHVPQTAAQTMAEGQFNRFYMLGLARRARAEGIPELEVYRARESESPRPESEALTGTRIPVEIVDVQLRDEYESQRSLLIQPNSGLSLRLPES